MFVPSITLCPVWFNIKFLYTGAITTFLFPSSQHIFLHRRISTTDLSNTLYKLNLSSLNTVLKSPVCSPVATVAMTELSDSSLFVCLK